MAEHRNRKAAATTIDRAESSTSNWKLCRHHNCGGFLMSHPLPRRAFLQVTAGMSAAAVTGATAVRGGPPVPAAKSPGPPTRFQVACMTLPYAAFPLQRALTGLRNAGYRYVAWGVNHRENGKNVPVLAPEATPAQAREMGRRCRDLGLEPVMMFSTVYPEANNGLEVLRARI